MSLGIKRYISNIKYSETQLKLARFEVVINANNATITNIIKALLSDVAN